MQVDVQSLDAQMVALYRKQNSLQAVLQRQRELCQQLTQVASHRIMNCLQSLVSQSPACTACRVRQKATK